MWPVIGGIAAGLGSMFGGNSANSTNMDIATLNNRTNRDIAEQTNNQNYIINKDNQNFASAQAVAQNNFQERMSNSSYSRSVQDMRNAGINPALAYMKGGASTPSGASASVNPIAAQTGAPMQSARVDNVMSGAVNSAMQAVELANQFKKQDSEIALNNASANSSTAAAKKAAAEADKTVADNLQARKLDGPARRTAEAAAMNAEKYDHLIKSGEAASKWSSSARNVSDIASDWLNPVNRLKQFLEPRSRKTPSQSHDDYWQKWKLP